MTKPTMYRQGDVLLVRISDETDAPTRGAALVKRDKGRIILAYGEVTGHSHAITDTWAKLFDLMNGERELVLPKESTLSHEEHGVLVIEPGTYRVTIQREYVPNELPRNVLD